MAVTTVINQEPSITEATSNSEGTQVGITPFAETVKTYPDYASAAKAACAWVEKGKDKVNVNMLEFYKGKFGTAKDKVVGVGYTPNLSLLDLVRHDMDDVPPGKSGGKGIHFNAVNMSDRNDKLAAVIKGTPEMSVAERELKYSEYLKALEPRSAQFIWNWWKTGNPI